MFDSVYRYGIRIPTNGDWVVIEIHSDEGIARRRLESIRKRHPDAQLVDYTKHIDNK